MDKTKIEPLALLNLSLRFFFIDMDFIQKKARKVIF